MLAGQSLREFELFVGIGQAVEEEGPGDGQQFGDLRMRQPVRHGVCGPGRGHHPVAAQRGEVLGEMRRFQARLGQQVADGRRVVRRGGQQLKDPDPRRMGEGLEQVRLDLVQGGLRRVKSSLPVLSQSAAIRDRP